MNVKYSQQFTLRVITTIVSAVTIQ